jgi:hypothetical protein
MAALNRAKNRLPSVLIIQLINPSFAAPDDLYEAVSAERTAIRDILHTS